MLETTHGLYRTHSTCIFGFSSGQFYIVKITCERRRISGCRFSSPREVTAGNTSTFTGYLFYSATRLTVATQQTFFTS